MSFCERVTEKQHILDSYVQIYQAFVDELNTQTEDMTDIYRQALLNNVEKMSKIIFDNYTIILKIKAAKDFGLPYEDSAESRRSTSLITSKP